MSRKPCPFSCGSLATYGLRAASARKVWHPGRYCPGCDTVFVVTVNGQGKPVAWPLTVPGSGAERVVLEGDMADVYREG